MASRCSCRVRWLRSHTSLPSPSIPTDTRLRQPLWIGPSRRCQCSHRPACTCTCSQARLPPQVASAAWSRTSRRSSAPSLHSGAAFALELTITSACAATCEKVIGLRVGLYVLRQSVYRTNACFGLYQYCRRYMLRDLCSFQGPKAPLPLLALGAAKMAISRNCLTKQQTSLTCELRAHRG